jgi:membrane protease YdiL (CAAX protease family)
MRSADERQPSTRPVDDRPLPRTPLVAPLWHTAVVLGVVVVISALGSGRQHVIGSSRARLAQYVFTLCWEWAMLAFCLWGTRKTGVGFRQLLGGRWREIEDVLVDVAIAFVFWIGAMIALSLMARAVHLGDGSRLDDVRRQLGFLVPRGTREVVLWIALSITAGVCEELIFRGYLQRQFTALAGNNLVGILASALVFGVAHGYEGAKRMLLIGVFGVMFGLLAYFRRSLRPGMMAHAFHDALTGLLLRFFLR